MHLSPAAVAGPLYHYAPTADRAAILAEGLDWRKGPHAALPLEVEDEETGELRIVPRANYLYRQYASAREALPSYAPFDIYEVDASDMVLFVDPYEGTEAVLSLLPVEPQRLTLAHEG